MPWHGGRFRKISTIFEIDTEKRAGSLTEKIRGDARVHACIPPAEAEREFETNESGEWKAEDQEVKR